MESGEELCGIPWREAREGDPDASRRLVEQLYPLVIRIVRHHLPRGMDEEDLAQEVFLRLFAKLASFRGERPLEHWVARITRNLCFDQLRRQRRRGELRCSDLGEEELRVLEAAMAWEQFSGGIPESAESTGELLAKLLGTLRPDEERVLRLLDLEGMAVREIASLLGWGESRVKVTAFRARKKLRDVLRAMEPGVND